MRGHGRLSLRARLLVLLIAVTAAFLLVMGGVTAFVSGKRLGAQFDGSLVAASRRSPAQLQADPGNFVAVLVTSRFPLSIQPLTGSTGTTGELVTAIQKMAATDGLRGNIKDVPFAVPGTSPRLRAVARGVRSGLAGQLGARHRLAAVLVVAYPVDLVARQVSGLVVAELITGGALILLLALGGRWLIGRGLAPLSEMAGTAQRITTQGDLTARMPDAGGSTEVGRLGTAINTMLDRIQQAFGARLRSEAKVRQFAADASHELRTPLTTIRGYAELYRQGALGEEQLPDAMRRIEQEARRMGTLVAELLELARLDRTSSLDIAETDLAVLVRDAAADARAVEPARPVRAEAPESLVAAVDEARIRQVLANLLGNVRSHTPVTTPTAVRLAQVQGGVVVEVADSGPGMTAADAARAFDRFHRGTERHNGEPAADQAVGYDSHGARATGPQSANGSGPAESGGSGLGLAIVAAIAQAHGGQATLESAPGQGTRVRVWLPTTPPVALRASSTPRLSRPGRPPVVPAPRAVRSAPRAAGPAAALPADPSARPAGPAAHPAGPPARPAGPPSRQPLASPVGYPVWSSRRPLSGGYPARPYQPLPGPAGRPAPRYAGPPVPRAAPPSRSAAPATPPVPPGPPAKHDDIGAAELHHDWVHPPQPVPQPVPPPGRPPAAPDSAASDDGGRPPSRRELPPPGRHRRVERGP